MDERRDPGEFYPGGRVMVRPDVAPPQMQVRWSDIQGKPDFSDVAELGEEATRGEMKQTMNTVINKLKTTLLIGALFVVGSSLADPEPLFAKADDIPGNQQIMTNVQEYVDAKVDFTTSNTQLVSTIEAATSNKADAVRMSVDGQVIVSCAWWYDDCLLTWNGFKWVWSSGRLGGSRQLTYNDGQWAFSPNVSPFVYTNAVPIYGLPESLVLYQDDESVTLTRTNEVYAAATNLHPVVYMDDMDAALTNVATKSELAATSNNVLAVARSSATNAAKIAAMPGVVTNIVRDLSLGGIWDSQLGVWWTPRMANGSLTYEATTNVNLNAEN